MTCKFASICELYAKDGVTCNRDNGGPFMITFFGKMKMSAYCGNYNFLESEGKKKVVVVRA